MAVALEAVDLAALCAEALAWALVVCTIILLKKLVSVMHFKIDLGIVSFEPLGWLANALTSYVIAGAEDARSALEGAMHATFNGLVWSINQLLDALDYLEGGVKSALSYLWHTAIRPLVHAIVDPVRTLASKAEAEVVSLSKTVADDLTKAERYASAKATAAFTDAEAFTRNEVTAARSDAARATAAVVARLDGINSQVGTIAGDVAAAPGIVWGDLTRNLDARNLADAATLAVLAAAAVHTLAADSGLENADCRAKVKGVCGTDPSQWGKLLAGLALMEGVVHLRELVDLSRPFVALGADLARPILDPPFGA